MPDANNKKNVGDKVFAVGDIHGCATELKMLLDQLPITDDSTVVFLGDYVDRGAHSKEVIEQIMQLKKRCHVVGLMGNHEDMMLNFLDDPASEKGALFIFNGGGSTLASYGHDDGTFAFPDDHLEFFRNLKLCHQFEEFFFVHAGLPNVRIEDLDLVKHKMEMMWIRRPFFESDFDWGRTIVHGHTVVEKPEIGKRRINIDTGCAYNNFLTAMGLPSKQIYQVPKQKKLERIHLREAGSQRLAIRFSGQAPIEVGQLKFLSLNYNEFGLYMRDMNGKPGTKPVFSKADQIAGHIGRDAYSRIPFDGQIIRVDNTKSGVFYAVKFTTPVRGEEFNYEQLH